MKAIFVSDENPAYLGFWAQQAEHMWTRFGLQSRLYYIADSPNPSLFTSDYAEVTHIPRLSTVPAIVQALFAKWYFPGQESSEERLFICDIDCFVLSRAFVAKVQAGTSVFHLACVGTSLPGYYVAGTPTQLRTLFRAGDISFEAFCLRALEESTYQYPTQDQVSSFSRAASPDWKYFGSEEHYAYACVQAYTESTDTTVSAPSPGVSRVCRSQNSWYDPATLRAGGYLDYHCPRPFEAYAPLIRAILGFNGPA
jgi:hypothetical protein